MTQQRKRNTKDSRRLAAVNSDDREKLLGGARRVFAWTVCIKCGKAHTSQEGSANARAKKTFDKRPMRIEVWKPGKCGGTRTNKVEMIRIVEDHICRIEARAHRTALDKEAFTKQVPALRKLQEMWKQ